MHEYEDIAAVQCSIGIPADGYLDVRHNLTCCQSQGRVVVTTVLVRIRFQFAIECLGCFESVRIILEEERELVGAN